MGIAQTKIDCKNPIGSDAKLLIRLSTNSPDKDVIISWKIDNYSVINEPSVRPAIIESGIPVIAQKLRERIELKKKNDPIFRPSEIKDELLVKALNVLSRWEGKEFVWKRLKKGRPKE